MRKVTLAGFALALGFAVGCSGGENFDALTRDNIKLLEEKAALLEGIKDRETAEKARPKLEEVNKKMKDLEERRSKLMKKDKEAQGLADAVKAEEKDKEALEKAGKRLSEARKKVEDNKEAATVLKGVNLGSAY